MVGPNMDADAVDLNSMWAMDAEYLARIADAIGQKLDAEGYRREYTATRKRIDQELCNPAQGIYCSKLWDGSFLTRLTPMNFYPLLAGIPDTERAEQVLSVMQDPKRFWGEWILPTVAYDDPVWPQQDYWKGKVWAPVNYLVFQGLLRYASPETINHFADRSLRLFMSNWESKGVCGENYLSKDGTQSSDPHYTWGSLLCLVGLESIVHTLPDGRIWLNGTIDAHAQLDNIPLGGRLYRVVVTPRHTELQAKHGGRILVASDKIAVGSL
jgi:neutral trehalase